SSPSALEALFERRDARVLAWLDRAAELLAPGLVSVESLLDPDALIFGGRFPQPLIAYLVGRLGEQMPLYRLPGKPLYPKLLLGQAQQDAACLGAATLPFYEEIAPSHHLLLKKTGSGVF
ncbi:MAG: ROK family transcriptional regulator, partial [Meiothermus sp.]